MAQRSRETQSRATWKAFSKYIRMRDSIRTTGTLTSVECFTCGKKIPTAASQAGHIISRAFQGALYNPQVVYAQCTHCNLFFEGMHIPGFWHLGEMVGWEKAIEICKRAMEPLPLPMEVLEDIEDGCDVAVEIMEQYYEQCVSNINS